MTSTTSATEELTALDNMICIFGLNSSRNFVPSPRTRQGSSDDRYTFPVPALAESWARETGTNRESAEVRGSKLVCMRTARQILGERSYNPPLHTLGSDQESRASP